MWTRLCLLLSAIVGALVVTGAVQHKAMTNGPENQAVATAVVALTNDDGDVADAIPADFADVMGYRPVVVAVAGDRHALGKPGGGCSVPGYGRPWARFDNVCKVHDFGYDVLRYAARTGGELGPWARSSIDSRFATAIHAECEGGGDAGCHALASAAVAAVEFNSWRQGNGVPRGEDGAPYAAAGGMVALALAGPSVAVTARRRMHNSIVIAAATA